MFWHKKCCVVCHGLKKKHEPLVDKNYDYREDAAFIFFNCNLCRKHEEELRERIRKQYGGGDG